MKKVAIFSANYLPNIGGVERYTYYMSRELANRQIKVSIITSNVFNLKDFEILSPNIEIYRLPCINLLNGRFPILKFWSNQFRKLNKIIRKSFYDLVIVNTRFYLHSLYGANIGKKCGKKVICIEHGSAHLSINSKFWDFLGRRYEHLITHILKLHIRDFYGVSDKCNEWLLHFNIKAKGCLYNAVDIKEIADIQKRFDSPNYIENFEYSEKLKIIVFTGRLVYEKGVILLLKAVNDLIKNYKRTDIHLFIAGNGPLKEECIKYSSSNIHILGTLSFEEVIKLLSMSDIFCLPSFFEGFSTSVLEAAACKTYIITTPVGGNPLLIKDETFGTLLPNTPSYYDIEKSILNVIDRQADMDNAINKTFNNLEEKFTWKKTVDNVCEIINCV